MESKVIFQEGMDNDPADYVNLQNFAQRSIDDIVSDTLTVEKRFAGFTVSRDGPTSVRVSPGRLYSAGKVYARNESYLMDFIDALPVAGKKIAVLVVWGTEIETDTRPREFLINEATGASEPRVVSMEHARVANLNFVLGQEDPAPAAPVVDVGLLVVAQVILNPTGIDKIIMFEVNRVPYLEGLSKRVSDLEAFRLTVPGKFVTSINGKSGDINLSAEDIPGVRPALAKSTKIYVNGSIGSDTDYDGSNGTIIGGRGPFRTITRAMQYASEFGPSPYTLTIEIAKNVYDEAVATPSYAIPNLIIQGEDDINPSNVVVTGAANSHTFSIKGPNTVTVRNLKVTASNPGTANCGFIVSSGASLSTKNTISGACNYAVFEAIGNSTLTPGQHTFAGDSAYAFSAINSGYIPLSKTTGEFTIANAIAIGTAFVYASAAGIVGMSSGNQPTFNGAAYVTGKRYIATLNGIINTAGLGPQGLPGTVDGSISDGGQYK